MLNLNACRFEPLCLTLLRMTWHFKSCAPDGNFRAIVLESLLKVLRLSTRADETDSEDTRLALHMHMQEGISRMSWPLPLWLKP